MRRSKVKKEVPESSAKDVVILGKKQRTGWKSISYRFLVILYSEPFKIVFLTTIYTNYILTSIGYIFLQETMGNPIWYTILAFDLAYLLKYIVSLIVFFWKTARLELNFVRRSKAVLILDLFLIFPYSYIYEAAVGESYQSLTFLFLRGIIAVRLMHPILYFREKMKKAGADHIKGFLIQSALFLMLLQQTSACAFYMMAWSYSIEEVDHVWTMLSSLRKRFQSPWEHYVICLTYVLFNIRQRTFGDIVPIECEEKILITIITFLGFTMTTGLFIGILSFLYEKHFQRQASLRHQIQTIKNYLTTLQMTDSDKKLIKNYYQILWEKKDGVHKAPDYPQLPFSLNSEIFVDINIGPLQKSTIFRDKPDAFLRAVSSLMKHEFYLADEQIYHANVIKDKMIFLVSGMINVLSDEDNESSVITFGAGTCLGEASLILTLPSRCAIKAACYTELQVLYRQDFGTLIDLFPEIYTNIQKSVMQRIVDAREKISLEAETTSINIRSYFSESKSKATIRILKEKLRGSSPKVVEEDKYLSMYKLDDGSLEVGTGRIFLNTKFPMILQPFTSMHQAWEYVIICVSCYITLIYPYYLIFQKKYPPFVKEAFDYIDGVLLLDFVVIMHTAIKEKNTTIKTVMQIIRKRLTQPGFYLDFLSCIKFEALCLPFAEDNTRVCEVLRLNRLLKFYRIPKMINIIDNKLKEHVILLRLIKYVIYLFITVYWFSALLYMVTCFDLICTEDGWYFTKVQRDIYHHLVNSYSRNQILTSIYYSLHYVTSPSMNDVIANNMLDMIMGYTATTFSLYILGYCVAELTATITRRRNVITKYQENFFALIRFMKEKHMPKDIIQRVENFFVVQWQYDQGAAMQGSIFHNANKNIQIKVEMAEKWDIIVNMPVFQGRNYDFLQNLVMETTTLILPPNEILHYKGEINTILYIIQEGYCVRDDGQGTEIHGPMSYFGTVSIFANVNAMTTVKTLTHVKVLCIQHAALWKCASMFPMVSKLLEETLETLDLSEDIANAKKIKIMNIDTDTDDFKGSIVNVISYCRSHGEDYGEPFRALSYMCWIKFILVPFCILPDGIFLKIWMAMRLIVASIVAILTPFTLIQYPYAPPAEEIFLQVLDTIAFVDLYVMMFVGFYGRNQQLIIHPLKTAGNYVKGKFLIDLVLCFPWEGVAMFMNKTLAEHHTLNYIAMFRIIRVFQIYRLPQFFNYLSRDIRRGSNLVQIAKYLPTIIISITFCAAILIESTCRYYKIDDISSDEIFDKFYVQPKGLMRHPLSIYNDTDYVMFCKKKSWIDRSKYRNITSPFKLYLIAIYFCTSTVTTCGFGDITPEYPSTLILTISMILFGFLFFGYIYAKISSHKADWRTLQLEQQAIVLELKHFMVTEKVNKILKKQIIERLEYRWKRNRGAEPNQILSNLNATLHEDAVMSMYEQILSEVPIFKNVDRSFFRVIGKIIREGYYLKQEQIYEIDDIVMKICILYRGTVKITEKNNPKDIYIGRGGIFGNISAAKMKKVSISAIAVTKADLLLIESAQFFKLLKKYPSIKQQIERSITNTNFIKPKSQENYDVQVGQEITEEEHIKRHDFKENCLRIFQIVSFWKIFRTSIEPKSLVCRVLDLCCLVLTYTNFIFATYEFSFRHHTKLFLAKSIVIDLIFLMRFLINLHKSYEDDYGEPVTSNKLILKRFFEKRRIIRCLEITANIPFYYIILLIPSKNRFLYFSCTRLITMCRFVNFYDYYEEKSNQLFANTSLLKIITTIMWVTLTIHIFACGWYLCACPLGECIENAWTSVYVKDFSDKLHVYVLCIYFMSGLFTATSNGDILPTRFVEQIYVTIVMILANFLIGVFIGDIMNSLNSATLTRVHYEQGIQKLELYLRNCNVSDFQMEKLRNYVRQLWTISDGNQTPRALSMLHFKTLHQLMTEVYGTHIKNAHIFKDVEEAFARQITRYVKRNIYFTGNYIVKHGDSDKSMYFIHSGEIDILTVHPNLTETVHEVLRAGDAFGIMQGLFPGVSHHFSYRARTTVHTVCLCLDDWEHLLKFFPDTKKAIYRNATTVYT